MLKVLTYLYQSTNDDVATNKANYLQEILDIYKHIKALADQARADIKSDITQEYLQCLLAMQSLNLQTE